MGRLPGHRRHHASARGGLIPDASPTVLVVGAGGIGGNVAAGLSSDGSAASVVCLSTNAEIAAAINERGYRVRGRGPLVGGGAEVRVPGRAVTRVGPDDGPFDVVILCTQPPQVEEAARSVVDRLAPDGVILVLQNGLCEERVAQIAGADRVVGVVVAWGASMADPGVYERTSDGGFVIGRHDGKDDPRLARLAALLNPVGPVQITRNLAGARWSKLAINCGISTLGTIGGDRLGPLMRLMWARRLGLEIVTEVVAVAHAEGVQLEKVIGAVDLDWLALTDVERRATLGSPTLFLKHSLMLGVGARYRNLRSSMLAAIERGRKPAVGFLNGEISERGVRHGIPTPRNDAAVAYVHAIASGERKPSVESLRALFDATRT